MKLRILERLDEGPVTVNELAEDFGLRTRHSHLLLSALVGLGIAEVVDGNEYRSTIPGFAEISPWLLPAGRLTEILEGRAPRHRVDTAKGSQQFYPTLLPLLSHINLTRRRHNSANQGRLIVEDRTHLDAAVLRPGIPAATRIA